MPDFRTDHARFDAILCDIDGCLVPEGPEALDAESLAELAAHNRASLARRDRPLVTLCSGRPQPFVEAMTRLIGNVTLPCVAENGVWLYHPGTNGYVLDPAITREHLEQVRAAARVLDDAFGPGSAAAARSGAVTQQPGKIASVSLFHPDAAYLRAIAPDVAERLRGLPLRVSMTWRYINCDLAHVSKGTGVERLLATAGLDRARVAGVGDTTSDLAIAERAAAFGCPANAAPEVRARAEIVSAHAEIRGVLDVIARWSSAAR